MCFICVLLKAQEGNEKAIRVRDRRRDAFSDLMSDAEEKAILALGITLHLMEGKSDDKPVKEFKPGDVLLSLFGGNEPHGGVLHQQAAAAIGLGFYIGRYLSAYFEWADMGIGGPLYGKLRESIDIPPGEHARRIAAEQPRRAEEEFRRQFGEDTYEKVKDSVRDIIDVIFRDRGAADDEDA